MSPQQLVYDFTYTLSRHDSDRPLRPFQRRDGIAVGLLSWALARLGYGYGGPLFNQPPVEPPEEPLAEPLLPFDTSIFRPGDLILQVTRPPIHDKRDGSMKQVERGYTTLEQRLFELWTPYFLAHCSRQQILLAPQQSQHLRQGYLDHAHMVFKQRGDGAPLQRIKGEHHRRFLNLDDSDRTAVFLLNLPEIWKNGPRYVCAFGMTGLTTMVWAYRLFLDHQHLLTRPGFYVYELSLQATPERALDLGWARAWKLEEMLANPFGPGEQLAQILGHT